MSYSNKYTFAALPRTARGTPLVLGGDPKGKNFLYTNGNSVIIRDIENPAIADVYTEHSCQVNVAKYSPSGFYIASGGKPIGGPIKDIAWSADSQRMVVVGEGRESGQSKPINSVDFRPARPFRIVTASEDNTLAVFEGPPFKFKCTKQLLSCSGDKTCAIWDIATLERTTLFNMGSAVENQQVSCLWQGKHLLSVSLSGVINYLDIENPDQPRQVRMGHNKPITCLARAEHSVFTASHDGCITQWNVETVHLYTLDVRTLTASRTLTHLGAVTDVKFSPDSKYLAASDANRKVILYNTEDYE
ncbi:putative wd40 repeat stress protein/actin, partial [Operophtera brumata]